MNVDLISIFVEESFYWFSFVDGFDELCILRYRVIMIKLVYWNESIDSFYCLCMFV